MALLVKDGVSADAEMCEELALQFLSRMKELRARLSTDDYCAGRAYMTGCKETAAVRRASLDLTRALAKMRRI